MCAATDWLGRNQYSRSEEWGQRQTAAITLLIVAVLMFVTANASPRAHQPAEPGQTDDNQVKQCINSHYKASGMEQKGTEVEFIFLRKTINECVWCSLCESAPDMQRWTGLKAASRGWYRTFTKQSCRFSLLYHQSPEVSFSFHSADGSFNMWQVHCQSSPFTDFLPLSCCNLCCNI